MGSPGQHGLWVLLGADFGSSGMVSDQGIQEAALERRRAHILGWETLF